MSQEIALEWGRVSRLPLWVGISKISARCLKRVGQMGEEYVRVRGYCVCQCLGDWSACEECMYVFQGKMLTMEKFVRASEKRVRVSEKRSHVCTWTTLCLERM
jgi:hypothetical protein